MKSSRRDSIFSRDESPSTLSENRRPSPYSHAQRNQRPAEAVITMSVDVEDLGLAGRHVLGELPDVVMHNHVKHIK